MVGRGRDGCCLWYSWLLSPAAKAQRKDPKRIASYSITSPSTSGQGISQDASLSTHQLSWWFFFHSVCSGGLSSLRKPLHNTPSWTSLSHRLLSSEISSPNGSSSGVLSNLCIFLCNHKILRLEETLEIIQLNPPNSHRNWGPEEWSDLLT